MSTYTKELYSRQRDSRLASAKRYYENNRELISQQRKDRRDPRKERERNLWRLYRLTVEDYDGLLQSQGGRCAVCQQAADSLVVDHDHACCTGRSSCGKCIRGLLCSACNVGIGHLREDACILENAVAYLCKGSV